MNFGVDLWHRLNGSRYSALAYKDVSPWNVPIQPAETHSIYAMFNSVRKCISMADPNRGFKRRNYSNPATSTSAAAPTSSSATKGVVTHAYKPPGSAASLTHATQSIQRTNTAPTSTGPRRSGLGSGSNTFDPNSSLHMASTAPIAKTQAPYPTLSTAAIQSALKVRQIHFREERIRKHKMAKVNRSFVGISFH